MINERDEALHEVGADPAWQESFYFNWADPERRSFTLARTGYRFHARKTDGLVISLRDGELELYYGPADLDHEGDCADEDPARGLRAGDLVVTQLEPLRRWRLQIEGERGMDVVFEAFTPPFDYSAHGARLARTMTGAHFEQSGRVRGWTHFGAQRYEIDALGQRDKSWGVRDWDRLEGWNWISGQLGACPGIRTAPLSKMARGGDAIQHSRSEGTEWTFNLMQTIEDGKALANGFVYRDGTNHPITGARIECVWGEQEHHMRHATIELVEADGRTHRLRAEALGSFPILRNDVWLEETHVAYTLESAAGRAAREGQGVVEHVWRATAEQVTERAPRLAAILGALRR